LTAQQQRRRVSSIALLRVNDAWSHTPVSWTVDCAAGGSGGGYTLDGSSGGCSGSVEVASGIRDGIPNTGGGGDGGGYFVPGGAGGDGVVVLRYCGRQCAPLPRTVVSFTDVSADPRPVPVPVPVVDPSRLLLHLFYDMTPSTRTQSGGTPALGHWHCGNGIVLCVHTKCPPYLEWQPTWLPSSCGLMVHIHTGDLYYACCFTAAALMHID
jgi:hypothetical protein